MFPLLPYCFALQVPGFKTSWALESEQYSEIYFKLREAKLQAKQDIAHLPLLCIYPFQLKAPNAVFDLLDAFDHWIS
jgi:hypothetical protein